MSAEPNGNDWEETTPVHAASSRAAIRDLQADVKYIRGRVNEMDGTIGGMTAAFTQDIDKLGKRMDAGFERLGELCDRAFREAETSSHDLSAFKVEVRKMKLTLPTVALAIGLGALALAATYLHIDQPFWLVGIEVAVGAGVASQFKPAVDTGDKS